MIEEKVVTTSLREAAYLYAKGNRILRLQEEVCLPYGLPELEFTLAGTQTEAEHRYYLSHEVEVSPVFVIAFLFAMIEAIDARAGQA